jgi:hypothetical protein
MREKVISILNGRKARLPLAWVDNFPADGECILQATNNIQTHMKMLRKNNKGKWLTSSRLIMANL